MVNEAKLEAFKNWLTACGCEIHQPTNEYEVLRFRSIKGVGVVYKGRRGLSVNSDLVLQAYHCFMTGEKWAGKGRPGKRVTGSKIKRQLIDRDGTECFYCGGDFTANDLTKEHLLSIVQGGPDRLENLVLACMPCNQQADRLPVIEKVKLRESKRQSNSRE